MSARLWLIRPGWTVVDRIRIFKLFAKYGLVEIDSQIIYLSIDIIYTNKHTHIG